MSFLTFDLEYLESSDDRVERFWSWISWITFNSFLCSVHAPAEVPSSALDLRQNPVVVENGWEWMRMVKMASKDGEHFVKTGFQRNFQTTCFGFPAWLHDVHPNFAPNFAGPGFKLDPSPQWFLSKSIYPFSSCETHTFSISLPSCQGNVPAKVWQRHTVCRDLRTTSPISASPGPRFHAAVVDRLATTINRCQPSPPFESF